MHSASSSRLRTRALRATPRVRAVTSPPPTAPRATQPTPCTSTWLAPPPTARVSRAVRTNTAWARRARRTTPTATRARRHAPPTATRAAAKPYSRNGGCVDDCAAYASFADADDACQLCDDGCEYSRVGRCRELHGRVRALRAAALPGRVSRRVPGGDPSQRRRRRVPAVRCLVRRVRLNARAVGVHGVPGGGAAPSLGSCSCDAGTVPRPRRLRARRRVRRRRRQPKLRADVVAVDVAGSFTCSCPGGTAATASVCRYRRVHRTPSTCATRRRRARTRSAAGSTSGWLRLCVQRQRVRR